MSCVLGKHCCSKLSPIAICHLLILISSSITQLVLGDKGSTLQPIPTEDLPTLEKHYFLQQLFDKYGTGGIMTFEGFEHLLENLGLGNIVIPDHDISAHKQWNGTFHDPDHMHGVYEQSLPVNWTNENNRTDLNNHATTLKASEMSYSPCPHTEHHLRTTRKVPKRGSRYRHGQKKHSHSKSDQRLDDHLQSRVIRNVPTNISDANNTSPKFISKCMSPGEILHRFNIPLDANISPVNFLHLCPAIVYELDNYNCACSRGKRLVKNCLNSKELSEHHTGDDHLHVVAKDENKEENEISDKVWIYGTVAVVVVSLCGLLGVAVVPIMQKVLYNHLLQFLVALAIGSLTGDALLHLIPHAIVAHEIDHSHDHSHDQGHEHTGSHGSHTHFAVWKGATALAGIYLFFAIERAMNAFTEFKKRKNKNGRRHNRMEKGIAHSSIVGVKLSSHDSIHPSCDGINVTTEELLDPHCHMSDLEDSHLEKQSCSEEICMDDARYIKEKNIIVHLDDTQMDLNSSLHHHHHHHHGHSHLHNHNHHHHSFRRISHSSMDGKDGETQTSTIASIAWMVIMGDGLHNFSDGLAIGAAFAGDITGGISTSIAVFCHELPHELGDFAVLLKAGMTVKQAVIYNCLSSVLCFIGMLIGIAIGNFQSAAQWVFALAAGMFLYIALVDMLPELNSVEPKAGENPLLHLAIQNVGICIGFTIMLLIAIFEDDFKFILD